MMVDIEKAERWLDEMKPRKDEWPEGATREHYLGALAMVESMGLDWAQLENGQHIILGASDADV